MVRTTNLILLLIVVSFSVALPAFRDKPAVKSRKPDPRIMSPDSVDHSNDYSNILPEDYVGPESCIECHQDEHDLWKSHPHSRMNRMPDDKTYVGDFDNAVLQLPTGQAHFVTDNDTLYMRVYKDGNLRRLYEVTRIVGSRYMEAYIGRQITGPEPGGHDIYQEHKLPYGYWYKLKRWVPGVYVNRYGDQPLVDGLPQDEAIDGEPQIRLYTANCMNCHNTIPYAYRIFSHFMVGFPDNTVSAEVHELARLLSDDPDVDVQPSAASFTQLNEHLDPAKHLISMGISCESCHFGGREHAIREREIKFLPTSKLTRISADDPRHLPDGDTHDAYTTRGICTQCHDSDVAVFPNGAGKDNSREGMDMFAGACASELSCINCHEPHTGTTREATGVDLARHINVCATCHSNYKDTQFVHQHAGPGHDTVNCLDCHMPKFTRGIDNLIRTHRIGMPVEESMVSAGMANACNACHLDKSVRWTLNEHEKIWGRTLQPKESWSNYYSLDVPAGELWLDSDDGHMRFLATQWYAQSKFAKEKFSEYAKSLNDPDPINRMFASFAISKFLGLTPDKDFGVDITAGPATRAEQIRKLTERKAEIGIRNSEREGGEYKPEAPASEF